MSMMIHTHYGPSGGEDLPPFIGVFTPIKGLTWLSLDSGTTSVTVEVTPSDVATPLDRRPWFAIFVNEIAEAVGQLGDHETLTLSDFNVDDSDTITIKWRSAIGVTNRLLHNETTRVILTMDNS